MNINTASKTQLENRLNELAKEYEKYKAKLMASYKKMDEIAQEYEKIDKVVKEKEK